MYCSKCGTQLPEDSAFCTHCGFEISKETIETLPNETLLKPQSKMTAKKKIIVIVAVCLIAILGIFFIINEIGKANLKKQLMRDWQSVEVEGITYYTRELDFSDDEIEYNFDIFYVDDTMATYNYDDTIATYNYSVISRNKFKIDDEDTIYTVEFSDDKIMMTVTPALTSADSFENWFHFDD